MFCFAVVVDDWCLKLMLGYVVVGYGKLMFVFDLPSLIIKIYFKFRLCCEWLCKVCV